MAFLELWLLSTLLWKNYISHAHTEIEYQIHTVWATTLNPLRWKRCNVTRDAAFESRYSPFLATTQSLAQPFCVVFHGCVFIHFSRSLARAHPLRHANFLLSLQTTFIYLNFSFALFYLYIAILFIFGIFFFIRLHELSERNRNTTTNGFHIAREKKIVYVISK